MRELGYGELKINPTHVKYRAVVTNLTALIHIDSYTTRLDLRKVTRSQVEGAFS